MLFTNIFPLEKIFLKERIEIGIIDLIIILTVFLFLIIQIRNELFFYFTKPKLSL